MRNFIRQAVKKAFQLAKHVFKNWDDLTKPIDEPWPPGVQIRVGYRRFDG